MSKLSPIFATYFTTSILSSNAGAIAFSNAGSSRLTIAPTAAARTALILDPIRHGILIFEFVHRRLEVMAILVGVGATRGWRSTVLDAARLRSFSRTEA